MAGADFEKYGVQFSAKILNSNFFEIRLDHMHMRHSVSRGEYSVHCQQWLFAAYKRAIDLEGVVGRVSLWPGHVYKQLEHNLCGKNYFSIFCSSLRPLVSKQVELLKRFKLVDAVCFCFVKAFGSVPTSLKFFK